MADERRLRELIQRVKDGDEAAADALVRQFEPVVLCAVRVYLRDRRLRRQFDSIDVSQSVFMRFFAGVNAGTLRLDSPRQLVALLTRMARNVFMDRERRAGAAVRDYGRNAGDGALHAIAGREESPSEVTAREDEFARAYGSLSDSVRLLVDRHWREGRTWPQIAEETGVKPDNLRRKIERAFARLRSEWNPG